MQPWLHVFACVAVPMVTGLILYAAFGVWDRRVRHADAESPPPIDYQI